MGLELLIDSYSIYQDDPDFVVQTPQDYLEVRRWISEAAEIVGRRPK